MAIALHVVDAFTTQRYAGNPAGVGFLPAAAAAEWMPAWWHRAGPPDR